MRILLVAAVLVAAFYQSECALAAMSIDLGSQFIKVGVIKAGTPMDIALNPESRRKTPNLLMIKDGHRTFGDAALALQVRHPQLVIGDILDLVGKSQDHPSFKLFKKRYPTYPFDESPRNSTAIAFKIGEESYTVEELLAMSLANAKKFTEAHADVASIKDAVITVPVYFTPAERLAVERAAQMANINVLQLLNDGTAAALSHGIFRRKEITEKPQRLLVYDVGSTKTTATIVEYKLSKEKSGTNPKMTVLGVGFDRTLGGLEITQRLRNFLVEKFSKDYKPKTDVRKNQRAMAKFTKEAERLKQVLSANADHFAQIESAHEDIDVKIKVSREDLNGLITDLEPRFLEPVEQALRIAQLPIEDIDQVVLFGAGTRVPKVQQLLQQFLGEKELGKFINTDEAATMGALFQAANLGRGFKVLPFNIEELVIYPIDVNFLSTKIDGEEVAEAKPVQKTIFPYKSYYPTNKKSITLTSYKEDFSITLHHGSVEHLTKKQIGEIGSLLGPLSTLHVNGLTAELANRTEETDEYKGVKVTIELNQSGVVKVVRAEANIEDNSSIVDKLKDTISGFFSSTTEEGTATDEKAEKTEEKPEEEAPPAEEKKEETTTTEESAKTTTEESAEEAAKNGTETAGNATTTPEPVVEAPKPKKPSIVRLKLSSEYNSAYVPNKFDVDHGKAVLEKFANTERLAAERAAAENELESYNFEVSMLVEEEAFITYSTQEERDQLLAEVARIRAWLEDDVTPETKTGDFKENLGKLKDIVVPVKKREDDNKEVPEAFDNLKTLLNNTNVMVSLGADKPEEDQLFAKEDRDAMSEKLEKLKKWIEENEKSLSEKKLNEDFKITKKDVEKKINSLNRELSRFMKKMKKVVNLEDLDKDGKKTNKSENKDKEEKKKTKKEKTEEKTEKKTTEDEEPPKEEL